MTLADKIEEVKMDLEKNRLKLEQYRQEERNLIAELNELRLKKGLEDYAAEKGKTQFYTIGQTNVEGYYVQNEDVDLYVCVEAPNAEVAKLLLEKIVEPHNDYCPCCGIRFEPILIGEGCGYDVPTIFGKPYTEYELFFSSDKGKIIIYYLDGRKEAHELKRRGTNRVVSNPFERED